MDKKKNIITASEIKLETLPNKVKKITGEAFLNCKNLYSVNIPSSVTYVGAKAFKVIPRPPEAEAVRPQMILTERASAIIGFGERFKIMV